MGQKTISDEEFIKGYSEKNRFKSRSDKYVKDKNNKSIKIGYWVFLAVVFLLVYYLFSEFYFLPK